MTKTYKIKGYKLYVLSVGIGDNRHSCRFETTGRLGANGAIYISRSIAEQDAIEATKLYKRGIIFIYDTDGGEKKDAETDDTATVDDREVKVISRVKTLQSAINILVNQYGVPMDEIQEYEQVMAKAEEIGVSFPNVKWV